MKSFLIIILILTLITGYKVSSKSKVKGWRGGWVDFICSYPNHRGGYKTIDLKKKSEIIEVNHVNKWKNVSRFSLYHNTIDRALRVIISDLQKHDEGEYECRFFKPNSDDGEEKEVKLELVEGVCQEPVEEKTYRETFTCEYPNGYESYVKFFCKESGPVCKDISSNGMFTLEQSDRQLIVSINEVSSQHQGIYWCGLKSEGHFRAGVQKITINGPEATSTSPSTSSSPSAASSMSSSSSTSSSTLATAPPAQSEGGAQLEVIIPAVCAAALVLLLLLVLVCKRTQRSKHATNGEAHNQREERTYEEIQERPQKPASGTALKTIYTTANFPTIPSARHEYDSITFKNHSAGAYNDTYSTVRDAEPCPALSAVSHPSGLSEDPFYSTLGNPQQQ